MYTWINDEFDLVDLNNPDDEIGISVCEGEREGEGPDLERNSSPTPMVGSKSPCASQSLRVNNVGDNEIGSYKEMTFKNKQELTNSFKIACLKNDFRPKKVINPRNALSLKCSYLYCNLWLRAVKFTSRDRFDIRNYENYHMCRLEHLRRHNPHTMTKVTGKYIEK